MRMTPEKAPAAAIASISSSSAGMPRKLLETASPFWHASARATAHRPGCRRLGSDAARGERCRDCRDAVADPRLRAVLRDLDVGLIDDGRAAIGCAVLHARLPRDSVED